MYYCTQTKTQTLNRSLAHYRGARMRSGGEYDDYDPDQNSKTCGETGRRVTSS